jgi:hypothetical protein
MFVNINKFMFEYYRLVLAKKESVLHFVSLSHSPNNGLTPVSVILAVNISAEYKQFLVWEKHKLLNFIFVQH